MKSTTEKMMTVTNIKTKKGNKSNKLHFEKKKKKKSHNMMKYRKNTPSVFYLQLKKLNYILLLFSIQLRTRIICTFLPDDDMWYFTVGDGHLENNTS